MLAPSFPFVCIQPDDWPRAARLAGLKLAAAAEHGAAAVFPHLRDHCGFQAWGAKRDNSLLIILQSLLSAAEGTPHACHGVVVPEGGFSADALNAGRDAIAQHLYRINGQYFRPEV